MYFQDYTNASWIEGDMIVFLWLKLFKSILMSWEVSGTSVLAGEQFNNNKSHLRETKNLLTNADSSTDPFSAAVAPVAEGALNWSSDLRANKRPQKKIMGRGHINIYIKIYTDIATTWKDQPRGQFFENIADKRHWISWHGRILAPIPKK